MVAAEGKLHRIAPAEAPEHSPPLHRAPFVAVAASFAVGVFISDRAEISLAAWVIITSSAAAFCIGALFFGRRRLATALVLLGFGAAGGTAYHYRCTYLPSGHIAKIVSDERILAKVRGTICAQPITRIKTPLILGESDAAPWCFETGFNLRLSAIISESGPLPATGKLKVKLYSRNPGIQYGDEVILTGQLQVPNSPTNPSQFDYRRYLRRQGIHAILYVSNDAGVEPTGSSEGCVTRWFFGARRRLLSLIARGSDERGGKVLAAMLLGAREQLLPSTVKSFQRSGTMHLLAISGLHVGMIAGFVWLLAGLAGAPYRVRSLVVILCVVCYVLLTGARPPAVRAAVMIVLIALGGVLSRRQIPINSLALAALIILIFSPGEVFMRGFQLSFIAVFSIVCFYRPIRKMLDRLKSRLEYLQAPEERSWLLRGWIAAKRAGFPLVSVSLAATIGVLPLIAHTFNIVSVIGIVCNTVLVPFTSIVVWLGLVGLLVALPLSLLWPAAAAVLWPAGIAAGGLERAAEAAAQAPFSYFYTAGPPVWFLVAYYALLAAVALRHTLRLPPRRCAVLFLILLNLLVATAAWPGRGRPRVTCFDVRHGTSVFFELPSGKTLLYDCGTANAFFDVGSYITAPALWDRGIHTIDLLILSHPDADHINGVPSLIENFRIGCVVHAPAFESEPLGARLIRMIDEYGIPRRELTARQMIDLGDTTIEALNPPKGPDLKSGGDPNNRSLVIRVSCSGSSFLLCGDIQRPATSWLLASGQDLRADVIFLPHHGSFYSNTADLLRAVEPRLAIVSCDRGYAGQSLLDTLDSTGIRTIQTAECGAIDISIEDAGLEVDHFVPSSNSQ